MSCTNTSNFSYTTGELIWDKSKQTDKNAGKKIIDDLYNGTILAFTTEPKTGPVNIDELYVKGKGGVTKEVIAQKGKYYGTTDVDVLHNESELYKLSNLCVMFDGRPMIPFAKSATANTIYDQAKYTKNDSTFNDYYIYKVNIGLSYKNSTAPIATGTSWWGGKKNKRRRTSKKTTKKSKTRRNKKG